VYETLAQDIVYNDPNNLVVFMDNHDIERAMFIAEGNIGKFKIALNLLLFTRGIPVIFYGTEIGISGGKHHGEIRQPFPGEFDGDDRYAFMRSERTEKENKIFDYLTELLKLRKDYPVLSKGKMRHIYAGDGLYIIIKAYSDDEALILVNTGENDRTIHPFQIKMFLNDIKKIVNVKSGKQIRLTEGDSITSKGLTTEIFLLKK
jgi:glycosidase